MNYKTILTQYKVKDTINSIFVYLIAVLVIIMAWTQGTYGKIGAVILGIVTILLLILPDNSSIF